MPSFKQSMLFVVVAIVPVAAGEPPQDRGGKVAARGASQAAPLPQLRGSAASRQSAARRSDLCDHEPDGGGGSGGTVAAIGAGNDGFWSNSTFTWGFEPEEGFVTGFIEGQPGYADQSLNWAIASSGLSTIEASARIGEGNAFSGVGKLRLGQDPSLAPAEPGTFSRVIDARVPNAIIAGGGDPNATGIPYPFTVSAEIFMERTGGSYLAMFPQANSQGCLVTRTIWEPVYGEMYVYGGPPGSESSTFPTFFQWTPGQYQSYRVEVDPCKSVIRHYLDDVLFFCSGSQDLNPVDGLPDGCEQKTCSVNSGNPRANCDTDADCMPGDSGTPTCEEWSLDLGVFCCYSFDQILFTTGNGSDMEISIDNVSYVRGEECPAECGNGIREYWVEECEVDEDCSAGEACVDCMCDPCPVAPALPEGESTWPAGESAGWYTWNATADAYGIDFCNTPTATGDTYLFVIAGTCDSYNIIATNDDCSSDVGYGDGSDPNSRCFNDFYNYGGLYPGFYPSCACVSTIPGQDYFVVEGFGRIDRGDLVINLERRDSCGELGSCCDSSPGSGGACTVTLRDDCPEGGLVTWYSGTLYPLSVDGEGGLGCSAAIECLEVTGACCDAITGGCRETVQADCDGPRESWRIATVCGSCPPPATGACCDRATTTCTEGVSRPACDPSFEWVEGATCEEIDCVFLAIPAVSTWGLLALALSLLILAKTGSVRAVRSD